MKKGQSGNNAAILVAVIAAVIILYILFLPADEKDDLIDRELDGSRTSEKEIEILEENVGRLDPVGRVRDKELSNIYIFETTNSKVLDSLNPVYVKNGVFDETHKTLHFSLNDVENTDNVMLSFNAPTRKGVLSIDLNGRNIYEYRLTSSSVQPIKIRKTLLDQDNELSFSVSGVGAKFWSTNEYSLEDIQIIGDITDTTRQQSENVFTLTETEHQNMEKAKIRFIPYCTRPDDVGPLDVFINNRNVFSAVPVCNDKYDQEIPISAISAGQNDVIFKTTQGAYSIEQVKLSFTEKDTPEAVYYFEINETTFEDIDQDRYDAHIEIEFIDDEENKRATIDLNDHRISIDTDEDHYDKNVDDWIEEDNNFIKITPRTTLDIVELRVVLEKN